MLSKILKKRGLWDRDQSQSPKFLFPSYHYAWITKKALGQFLLALDNPNAQKFSFLFPRPEILLFEYSLLKEIAKPQEL